MNTNRQYFRDFLSTAGTELRRAGGVDLNHFSLSLFRYLREPVKEQTPRSVRDASGEVSVTYHPLNVQIFDNNLLVVTDVVVCRFVSKVFALIGDFLMEARDYLLRLLSASRATNLTGKGTALSTEIRKGGFQEMRILSNQSIRVNGETLHSHINTYGFGGYGETARLNFITGKRNEPLARRGTANRNRFDLAFNGTGEEEFEFSDAVNGQQFSIKRIEGCSQGERVISALPLEAREARLLPKFDSSKEILECQVHPLQRLLNRVCPTQSEFRKRLFQFWQFVNLVIEKNILPSLLPHEDSLLKRGVVEEAVQFEEAFSVCGGHFVTIGTI